MRPLAASFTPDVFSEQNASPQRFRPRICWGMTMRFVAIFPVVEGGAIKNAVFSIIRCIIAYLSVRLDYQVF
ncbi:MAG: hypothetical protein D3911_16650 [Candidatus Electrothrix sp. AW3_4]|nr:hypothetical protein [Candidatus Electrothrix gigas]